MDKEEAFFPGPWGSRRRRAEKVKPKAERRAHNPTLDVAIQSTDFQSAMRKNLRAAFFLFSGMVLLSALVGYVFGWGAEIMTYNHPDIAKVPEGARWHETLSMLAYSSWGVVGVMVMLVLFSITMLFTLWRGDRALMHLSGARPADPEKDAMLHNIVEEVAIAAGKPKPRVYVIETDAYNAFATGIRPSQSSVAATRGIMKRLNREELQGVMAHEMGHIINGDVRNSVALAVMVGLITGISALMRELFLHIAFGAARSSNRSSSSSKGSPLPLLGPIIVVWAIVALLAPLAAVLLKFAASREREYLADATAVKLTRNPKALASALLKISENPTVDAAKGATAHLFIENPKAMRSWSRFLSTHPPIEDRVERLRNLR